MESKKLLDSFTQYCKKYPELRFWQALRGWARVDRICIERYDKEVDDQIAEDTFYFKGIRK